MGVESERKCVKGRLVGTREDTPVLFQRGKGGQCSSAGAGLATLSANHSLPQ